LSVLLAVAGFLAFEMLENDGEELSVRIDWHLLAVIGYGVVYLILVDHTLPMVESGLGVSSTQAALVTLPYYWIGFALGILTIFKREVQGFAMSIWRKPEFLALIIILEIVGMLFYFFELFGLSGLTATLVALITGAHIILVWLGDLYVLKRYKVALARGEEKTRVLFFQIPTTHLEEYNKTKRTLGYQALAIVVVLIGIALWPN